MDDILPVTLPTESSGSGQPASGPEPRVPAARQMGLHVLLLLLAAVLVTGSMWYPALLAGHSARFDLARMVEFDAALRAGDWVPIWSPDFYFGYGSPLFQFYSPLAYYLSEIPVLAGLDVPTALKVTQLTALLASGIAMYFLAADHLSRCAACFGAILYMVAPYRFVDIFVRHALAEHCAFVWLPLIVLGTRRFVAERSRSGLAAGVVATAGLVLTHNVMALIGLPVCVAAGWVIGARNWNWRHFLMAGVPAVLGVGVATFFWWPALSGRPLTFAEESLTGGYFDFRNHFVDVAGFLSADWGFGESGAVAGVERMPMQIGWVHLAAGVASLGLMFRIGRGVLAPGATTARWLIAGVVIMWGALLMCHAASLPLWSALPLVKYVQFPWRFLGLVVFGAAMCGAFVMDRVASRHRRWERAAFAVGVIAVLAIYFPCYAEARFMAIDRQGFALVQAASDRLKVLESAGRMIAVGSLVTPEAIRAAGERATSSDDFLPRGVKEKPTQPSAVLLASMHGEVRQASRLAPNRYAGSLAMREPGRVVLSQFWFPGWTAWVDGGRIETAPWGKTAVVSCEVPAGEHTVEFGYLGLPQRRTGILISWLSLAAVGALAFFSKRRSGVMEGGAA
jgi:hypothetical protein